ncbi:MAG: YdeI/OmpD-associated family protein [Candidatus Saccharimonadales bacterium]
MKSFSAGTVRTTLLADFREQLTAQNDIGTVWESLTPLARNEWLCWLKHHPKNQKRAPNMSHKQSKSCTKVSAGRGSSATLSYFLMLFISCCARE